MTQVYPKSYVLSRDTRHNQSNERPEVVTDDMLDYLDLLRETGATNMFGAAPFVQEEFELSRDESRTVLTYWMRTFGERHADE